MGELVKLIIYLIMGGLIVWLAQTIVGLFAIPPEAKRIIVVAVGIIVVLWLISVFVPGVLP